jgi:hypothetical protein
VITWQTEQGEPVDVGDIPTSWLPARYDRIVTANGTWQVERREWHRDSFRIVVVMIRV